MEILSNNHKQIIIDLNKITDNEISVGGSLEDYLLLGNADKPIGDIDFIVDDNETFEKIKNHFDLPERKPSYYSRLCEFEFRDKYTIVINGVTVDFLVDTGDSTLCGEIVETVYDNISIKHRALKCKIILLENWVRNSIPNDMWAYDKFTKILKKYEGLNNM